MSDATSPFQVVLSIEDPSRKSEGEFAAAASDFLNSLRNVEDLNIEVPQIAKPGTRGFVEVLTAIGIWGAKIGAFKALFNLAQDLFNRYHGAEVILRFHDGSTLKLKGVSRQEAERLIEDHLRRARA